MTAVTAQRVAENPRKILVEVDAARLHNALKLATLVSRRSSVHALRNVHLTVTPKALIIRATDLELEAQSTILTTSCSLMGGTRSLCLAPDALKSALPKSGPVQLEVDSDCLRVGSYTIRTEDDESFPIFEVPWTSVVAAVDLGMLRRVAFGMSKDTTRPNLCTCFMESVDGQLRLVTTDGHRLARLDTRQPYDGPAFMVPGRAVEVLLKLKGESAALGVTSEHLVFSMPQWGSLRVKPVEGTFPDYRIVIPSTQAGSFAVNREKWTGALKRLLPLVKATRFPGVRYQLVPADDAIALTVTNEGCSATETVRFAESRGDLAGLRDGFGLNLHYTLEALGAIESPTVEVGYQSTMAPFRFKGGADDTATHVIMPMRI